MAPFLSAILKRRSSRSLRDVTSNSLSVDKTQPAAQDSEDSDLGNLNGSLRVLTDVFPNVHPEVFREMLKTFSEESRLQIVTENIMKHEEGWVRGRYRIPRDRGSSSATTRSVTRPNPLPREDTFRSRQYREAVQEALSQEFGGLRKSTINSVLAECNYSYFLARPTLIAQSSKSWRFSITSFLARRRTSSLMNHPLVEWKLPFGDKSGPLVPTLRPTRSAELNQELFGSLIEPYIAKETQLQIRRDRDVAELLNNAEAEEAEALYECQCCFTEQSFERMSACDGGIHFICFRCVRSTVHEALYGQGWTRSVDMRKGTLRCIALPAATTADCHGWIPRELIQRALDDDDTGREQWQRFEERLSSDSLIQSGASLVRCPFCAYAELDETLRAGSRPWRLKNRGWLGVMLAFVLNLCLIPAIGAIVRYTALGTFLALAFHYLSPTATPPQTLLAASRVRLARRRRGLRFTCRNPSCRALSCMVCGKEWRDVHVCYESERQALRVAVERAMDEAVKRTCPRCCVSFVKSSGCNKLTCPCGYKMCNVCRSDLSRESYTHFCQHFRANPGRPCEQCDRCDLYRMEDEEDVRQRAAKMAEREWQEKENQRGQVKGLGGDETAALSAAGAGLVLHDVQRIGGRGPGYLQWWSTEAVLDYFVEQLVD